MLRRKVFDKLMSWKNNPHRDCIVLTGKRQVGKTFIVCEFGKTYPKFVNINFSMNPSLKLAFEGDLDVDSIISQLKLLLDPDDFVPGSTLILLDEIQDCDGARTSLKFFAEDGRYDVIGTGSLMGVMELCRKGEQQHRRPTSVGFERHIEMTGLDFEEFLWATGVEEDAIDVVRKCLADYGEIPAAHLNVFQSRFRDFMVVGGMPAAVQKFVETHDYTASREIILSLVDAAKGDINTYNAGVNVVKTADCYESIPNQLDSTNKKFMYSRITGEGSRKSAEKYMDNLLWIKASGHGLFCYSLTGLGRPRDRFIDRGSFRVYMPDTGTLANLYGIPTMRAILSSDYSCNVGAIAENAVAESLVKCGYSIAYYRKSSGNNRIELDFVIESDCGIVVIEVKSGKSRDAPSINAVDSDSVTGKLMLREGNIGDEKGGIRGYPIFASAFMNDVLGRSDKLPKAVF